MLTWQAARHLGFGARHEHAALLHTWAQAHGSSNSRQVGDSRARCLATSLHQKGHEVGLLAGLFQSSTRISSNHPAKHSSKRQPCTHSVFRPLVSPEMLVKESVAVPEGSECLMLGDPHRRQEVQRGSDCLLGRGGRCPAMSSGETVRLVPFLFGELRQVITEQPRKSIRMQATERGHSAPEKDAGCETGSAASLRSCAWVEDPVWECAPWGRRTCLQGRSC